VIWWNDHHTLREISILQEHQKVFMAGLPQVLMDNGEGFSTCAIFNQDK